MAEKTKTNADRIREMSDEELAEFIAGCNCPPYEICCDEYMCTSCWLEWLRSPVEESGK